MKENNDLRMREMVELYDGMKHLFLFYGRPEGDLIYSIRYSPINQMYEMKRYPYYPKENPKEFDEDDLAAIKEMGLDQSDLIEIEDDMSIYHPDDMQKFITNANDNERVEYLGCIDEPESRNPLILFKKNEE